MRTKRYSHAIAALLLTLTLFFTGCAKAALTASADKSFEAFTEELFRQDVASSTLSLHYTLENPKNYDIEEVPITFGSFEVDETASLAALENCQSALEKFPYNALSEKNRITYDVLSSHIDTAMEGTPYALYYEPMNSVTGIQAQLPVLLAEYTFTCEEDVRTYLDLIATMPDYFHSLIAFERRKSEAGLFMNSDNADSIIDQCQAFLSMGEDNYLLSTFEERLGEVPHLSHSACISYVKRNKELLSLAVLPAYQALVSALKELRETGCNTKGLCYFPKGKEYYAYLIGHDTGSSRTVLELDALIQSQMASDLLDMQTVVNRNPAIADKEAVPFDTKPEHILENLKDDITPAFPEPAKVETTVKYVPDALEEYLSPAFYLIPAIDNTSENVIYINRGQEATDINLFTTIAHEGYPGHLYQTTYFANTDPNPVRSILNFEGYTEGWATYAEMCSYYLSPLDKPSATLLQKNSSLILGMYAAADIGIHYHGWDLDKTSQYFKNYGIENEKTIREIYELIIADPGNYLKYYIGYVEFLELKKEAIRQEGADFSQKEFHKKVLEIGPAPFSILRKYLLS